MSFPGDDDKGAQQWLPLEPLANTKLNDVARLLKRAEEANRSGKTKAAIAFYEEAAELKDTEAMAQLGKIYYKIYSKTKDAKKKIKYMLEARDWFEKALKISKQENGKISAYLGTIYLAIAKLIAAAENEDAKKLALKQARKHLLIAAKTDPAIHTKIAQSAFKNDENQPHPNQPRKKLKTWRERYQ